MSNASALFRSLLVYGLCLPLAVFLGYLLADPMDFATISVVVVIFAVLMIPLLLRWHHAWLIATWNTTAVLFFVPGRPQLWTGLAAASFTISILQYTLNRRMKFLHVPAVARPLLFLAAVVLLTARLTGGMGTRAFGSDTYGGKRYFMIVAGIIGYFAIIHRQIPPKRVNLYVTLFFLGAGTLAIGNLPGVVSPSLNFLFIVFPVMSMAAFTDQNSVVGATGFMGRVTGFSALGLALFCAMLARYGIRGILDMAKPWRLGVFCLGVLIGMLSGFRNILIVIVLTFGLLFYLERLHRTRLLIPLVLTVVAGAGLMGIFSNRLPYSIQRSLSFLPIPVDPVVKMDAQGSSEWRLGMWRDVIPQIPQYLIVGKGYAFSAAEAVQLGRKIEGAELVGDYHSGPLSVLLPFGIFGAIAFLWLLIASFRALYQNYQFGDPAFRQVNAFILAYYTAKIIIFFVIFGSLYSDLPSFLGLFGLSVSLNGGVAKPAVVPQPKVVFNRFRLHPSVRRPMGV